MKWIYLITAAVLMHHPDGIAQCSVQIVPQGSTTICNGDSLLLIANSTGGGPVIDQQQLNYNGGTSARNLPGYSVWQSFTAGITGTMTQIDWGLFTYINGTGTFNIFSGTGTGGALLQSQIVTIFCGGGNCWVPITVNVPVVAGQVYTFHFIPGPAIPDPYGVQVQVPGTYAGGQMAIVDPSGTYLPGFDMVFKTYVGSSLFMQWSTGSTNNSITATTAGTYYVVATDSAGCTATDSVTVTVNNVAGINLGNDTSVCAGDTVWLDATGSFTNYQWQDGSTGEDFAVTNPGVYWVMVTDSAGCNGTDSIFIANGNCTPAAAFASTDTVLCEKNCIGFSDLTTNNANSWQWYFPNANPDTSTLQNPQGICYNTYGSYNVKLVACNNYGCDTLLLNNFITVLPSPADSIYGLNDTLWSLPFMLYQWFETSGLINGATMQYYVPVQPGNYYCIVTDTNGCVTTSNVIAITSAGNNMQMDNDFKIYPNPADDYIEIVCAGSKGQFKLTDVTGKTVYDICITHTHTRIYPQLNAGVYIGEMSDSNKRRLIKVLIKH